MYIIAIDLGGTSSKCALYSLEKQKTVCNFKIKTSKTNILQNLKIEIDNVLLNESLTWNDIDLISFAMPGFLEAEKGIVNLAANLNWKNFNIKEESLKIFKKNVIIENDANAAAFGEYVFLKKEKKINTKNLLMYTLGTGVGGGIIINSKLFRGTNGFAGEFGHGGHFQTKYSCNCGLANCMEALSSARGLLKLLLENKKILLENKIFKTAEEIKLENLKNVMGHPVIVDLIKYSLKPLASHMQTLIYSLNPDSVVLSGGLTLLGEEYLKLLISLVFENVPDFVRDSVKIYISELQEKAGMFGTIQLALNTLSNSN